MASIELLAKLKEGQKQFVANKIKLAAQHQILERLNQELQKQLSARQQTIADNETSIQCLCKDLGREVEIEPLHPVEPPVEPDCDHQSRSAQATTQTETEMDL